MKRKTIDKQVLKIKINLVATVRDAATGRVKRVHKYHNIIPTVGRAAIASYLGNVTGSPATLYPNKCALGTNTTTPANSDTQLGTETYRNDVASRTSSSNIAYISGFFTAGEVTGTFREAGLFIAGTGSANTGTLFSHVAINVTKSGTETLTLDWTFTIS